MSKHVLFPSKFLMLLEGNKWETLLSILEVKPIRNISFPEIELTS
jgi:hypothetical protein